MLFIYMYFLKLEKDILVVLISVGLQQMFAKKLKLISFEQHIENNCSYY